MMHEDPRIHAVAVVEARVDRDDEGYQALTADLSVDEVHNLIVSLADLFDGVCQVNGLDTGRQLAVARKVFRQ